MNRFVALCLSEKFNVNMNKFVAPCMNELCTSTSASTRTSSRISQALRASSRTLFTAQLNAGRTLFMAQWNPSRRCSRRS